MPPTTVPSCLSCPSYVAADEHGRASTYLGKAPGVGFCAATSQVIAREGMDEKAKIAAGMHLASNCDLYGEPAPDATIKPVMLPFLEPNQEVIVAISAKRTAGGTGKKVTSCNSCQNCLKTSDSHRSFGVPMPICTVKGTIIVQPSAGVRGCPYVLPGKPAETVPDNTFYLPHLFKSFRFDDSKVIEKLREANDPLSYVSDKPVEQLDKDMGIQAWRKVPMPNGEPVFLPIFSPDTWDNTEARLVPRPTDLERPDLYVDYSGILTTFALTAALGETPLLIGQPGTGKTEALRWLAYLMQVPFYRFQITKTSQVEDLVGSPQFADGKTFFQEGRLPIAYRRPCLIDLDEVNLGPPEVREVLRPLTDNSKQFVIDSAHGVVVDKHPHCYLAMTINPAWDMRNSGAEDFAAADANRLCPVWMPDAPENVLRSIVKSRCAVDGYDISDDTLNKILAVGEDIARFAEEGLFPDHWGTRQVIKVARLTKYLPLLDSFKRASLDFYDPREVEMIITAITGQ